MAHHAVRQGASASPLCRVFGCNHGKQTLAACAPGSKLGLTGGLGGTSLVRTPPSPLLAVLLHSRRREAARDAAAEPILSSMLHACILSHDSFEEALAFVLAKRLASSTLLAMELGEGAPVWGRAAALDILPDTSIEHCMLEALQAWRCWRWRFLACLCHVSVSPADDGCFGCWDPPAPSLQDPACTSYSHALLHFKGFHAVQVSHAVGPRHGGLGALFGAPQDSSASHLLG